MRSAEVSSREPLAPSPSQKLRLVDSLTLAKSDIDACRIALDWMQEHAGVRAAIVALLRQDDTLEGVAGLGAPQSRVMSLRVDTRDPNHPLVAPLKQNTVVRVPAATGASRASKGYGLERAPHLVIPLWGAVDGGHQEPLGVLALAESRVHDDKVARWTATRLAHRLATLRSARLVDDARREVREMRALLAQVIAAFPDPVVLADIEGHAVLSNPNASALLVASEDVSPDHRRAVARNVKRLTAICAGGNGREGNIDIELVDPVDGSRRVYEAKTVETHGGERVRTIAILRNITDLRKATNAIEQNLRKLRLAEADVRAERDRLDVIIDSVADPILVTDPSGEIALMNVPAEHLFTVAPSNDRENAHDIVQSNARHFGEFAADIARGGHGTRWRAEVNLADPATGQPLPVEAIAGRISGDAGELVAVVTILHDRTEAIENARLYEQLKNASSELERKIREATTELVRQNELLQRQALELEHASNLKSQFLANVSHEFRTPLNAILGYTSMLLQGVAGDVAPASRKHLSRVDSNARHLLAIISDILDIARIESGRMPVNTSEFELSELIAEIGNELEPIIQRSSVEVVFDIDPTIATFRSDRQKLKQIVLNLLSNALKFTHEGSIRVHACALGDGDQVTIDVTDTGIGIDPRNHEKVFEDFQQADNSTTRQYGGTGLGLSICRRLARMLGGEITLQSEIGRGSVFTLTIPRRLRRK